MISSREKWYYLAVKKLWTLSRKKKIKNNGNFYYLNYLEQEKII